MVAPYSYTGGTLKGLTDEVNNIGQIVVLQCVSLVIEFVLMQLDMHPNNAVEQVHLLIATAILCYSGPLGKTIGCAAL